jgi:lipid A 3-O-deacylase
VTLRLRASTALLAAAASLLGASPCFAQDAWWPSAAFAQAGSAGQTHQLSAGFVWEWARQWALGPVRLSGYHEAAVAMWSYPDAAGRRTAWLGQVGVTPVLRLRPDDGASPWFAEVGVGLTFTTALYETQRKRFSTSFNFGDHIGVGRNFGVTREHELALRIEHFSNAGIKSPNPGENFVQLRYSYRFR